jgi:hypothetical protein
MAMPSLAGTDRHGVDDRQQLPTRRPVATGCCTRRCQAIEVGAQDARRFRHINACRRRGCGAHGITQRMAICKRVSVAVLNVKTITHGYVE